MADAEDFNPLRIRPYVNLGRQEEDSPAPTDDAPGAGLPPRKPGPPPAHTMPLRVIPPPDDRPGPAPYETQDLPGHAPGGQDGPAPYGPDEPPRRRARGTVLLAATAAAAILVGAAFTVGAFDGEPDAGRALPAGGTPTAAPTPLVGTSARSTPSRAASAATRPTASVSPTARPTPTRATRSATPTPTPTVPPSKSPTATATSPLAAVPPSVPPAQTSPPGSLTEGSTGPEVQELQGRLSQVWLYRGPMDGLYSSRVTTAVASYQSRMRVDEDPEGVYGPATRASLERFTRAP